MKLPATTLKDAFNACDPTQALPAGDQRYVDLAAGRGEEGGAVSRCRKRILLSDERLVQLFAGHRGCGKSTELRRLQRDLERDGYFVVYVEAESDLDLEDTEPPDVLLALIRGLDAALRDADIAIAQKHFWRISSSGSPKLSWRRPTAPRSRRKCGRKPRSREGFRSSPG